MGKNINTISDERWAELQRQAGKAAPPRLSPKAIRRWFAVQDQRTKAIYN